MTKFNIDVSAPVGQIARFFPATLDVLEEMDVEYATKGGRTLGDVARAAGVDLPELLARLKSVATESRGVDTGVADLVHTIVTEHHRIEAEMMKDVTERLERLEPSTEASRIRRIFADLVEGIRTHMLREERELFPRIEELDLHPHRVLAGSLSRPLLVEFVEHDVVHEQMVKIRELAARLRGRADQATIDALTRFDRLTHRHIHLENNVLIPRVIDLENRLRMLRRDEATG